MPLSYLCYEVQNLFMLKQSFEATIKNYSNDQKLRDSLWSEIESHYGEKKRYYHNLSHLENMLTELNAVRSQITDWDTVMFALFYHDIIYKSTAKDNEERSADLAVKRLRGIDFPQITKCAEMILLTKAHSMSDDNDTNLFTDADLSILGKSWNEYEAYFRNVRKEYGIYPDFLYKPGRKKVLDHFLSMKQIFKTKHFYELYEMKGRENLKRESGSL